MHSWSDRDVDWGGINDAARFIALRLRFWRVDVRDYKEKWGTVRVYCSLGIGWWPQLTHPGHVFLRWPRCLDFIAYGSYKKWSPLYWLLRLLNLVVVPFHKWLYVSTYAAARKRWPHLAQEIYRCADYYELLGAEVDETSGIIWWPEWDQRLEVCANCGHRGSKHDCGYCAL